MKFSNILWIIVIALIFYIGFKVVPIYYKGLIGIRGVCKEQADLYKKYGRAYIFRGIDESLNGMGLTEDKREYTVNVTENAVLISITYYDEAEFFDRYTKEFEFSYECEGALKSVL